jgi:NAD(P)-dependent dehydrogenase (short-subunit alcohol dehydrogenase family)
MSLFDGLHVVVTGGTGALGRAVITALRDEGASCHVPNFDRRELASFPYTDIVTEGVDLGNAASVDAFYAALPPLWASLHVAGGFDMGPIAEAPPEIFETQWRMNALTAYLCSRAAVKSMRRRGQGGRIVNVAARPALEPRLGAGMAAYAASKAAVAALTVALGEELADEEIWVNAVAPATLDTPANRAAMPKADHSRWTPVDAVARVMVELASPANRTVRGAVVPVYGRVR